MVGVLLKFGEVANIIGSPVAKEPLSPITIARRTRHLSSLDFKIPSKYMFPFPGLREWTVTCKSSNVAEQYDD